MDYRILGPLEVLDGIESLELTAGGPSGAARTAGGEFTFRILVRGVADRIRWRLPQMNFPDGDGATRGGRLLLR